MGKRSDFERKERDFYPTPAEAVRPLLIHLDDGLVFAETCAGDGSLIHHLEAEGFACGWSSDLAPAGKGIVKRDALTLTKRDLSGCDAIVTNPPWPAPNGRGQPTLTLIRHLSAILPTWLLLPSDFAFNRSAAIAMRHCSEMVAVGRVKWFPDSAFTGMDNCGWFLFEPTPQACRFYPRSAPSLSESRRWRVPIKARRVRTNA